MKKFSWVILFALAFTACEKEVEPGDPLPEISHVPEISFGTIATTYNQFDDIVLKINYIDGDGDLGFENADTPVVFIVDTRDDIELNYHVPPLSPIGVDISIQGELQIVVENIILLDQNNTSETLTFTARIVDRAGNFSNVVTTSQITVNQ